MKQIVEDIRHGSVILEEVPVPQVKSGCLLIKTTRTLVSLGTERMLVAFGKANLIDKARLQPDKVKQVLDKIKTDGLQPTIDAVRHQLEKPLPLGYCHVGRVVAVGPGVSGFQVGDRVASNGSHAEYVCVPQNLVAKIPERVTDEEATFTVVGAIALQGIRNLKPQFGETIVVIGLGLIGLLAVQLLKANGCRVIGVDVDAQKVEKAKSLGVTAVCSAASQVVMEETNCLGADGVLITASTSSDAVMHQACEMSRKRGRIVLIGVVGLHLRRDDFYKKELTFQVSCSYGAGRYDADYEQKGHDYPPAYVRWTEKRNFQAVLEAMSQGSLQVRPLISKVLKLDDWQTVYEHLDQKDMMGCILTYPEEVALQRVIAVEGVRKTAGGGKIGIIGAGHYTASTVVPCMLKAGASIKYIASAGGLSAKILSKKAGAELATSDYREILKDPDVSLVLITTPHHLHASMTIEALKAGKSVFVEKPLCITSDELNEITEAYRNAEEGVTLTVGYNRRFSPFAIKMKSLAGSGPMNIVVTMNAGTVPASHWVHDMEIGGGRILGEACHLIDLCSYLADSRVKAVCMNGLGETPQMNIDNASILLRYENGTNAVINYFANGSKAYPKERIEVFSQGKVLVLDNWRQLEGYGVKGFSKMKAHQDKGHLAEFRLLNERVVQGGESLIPFESLVNTSKASFAAIKSMMERKWIDV